MNKQISDDEDGWMFTLRFIAKPALNCVAIQTKRTNKQTKVHIKFDAFG